MTDDGGKGILEKRICDAPTGNVLTCHKIHLPTEADSHEKGIEVGGVVGKNDIIVGKILRPLELVSELDPQKERHGRTQKMPENKMAKRIRLFRFGFLH